MFWAAFTESKMPVRPIEYHKGGWGNKPTLKWKQTWGFIYRTLN